MIIALLSYEMMSRVRQSIVPAFPLFLVVCPSWRETQHRSPVLPSYERIGRETSPSHEGCDGTRGAQGRRVEGKLALGARRIPSSACGGGVNDGDGVGSVLQRRPQ